MDGILCSIPFQIDGTAVERVAVDVPYTSSVVGVRQEMFCHEPFDTIPSATYLVVWLMSAVQQMHQNATSATDIALVANVVAFDKLLPRLRGTSDQKTCGDADCVDYVVKVRHHRVFFHIFLISMDASNTGRIYLASVLFPISFQKSFRNFLPAYQPNGH